MAVVKNVVHVLIVLIGFLVIIVARSKNARGVRKILVLCLAALYPIMMFGLPPGRLGIKHADCATI